MQIDNQYFKQIIKDVGDSTSNKICKRIETLEAAKVLDANTAFILKSELKNIVHESFREVKNHMICWNQGFTFNKIYSPTKEKQ